MPVYLAAEVNDRGWITISQYNSKTTEWDEIRKNYAPWNYREQFLRDVENWYGKDVVPAYRAALDNAPHFGGAAWRAGLGKRIQMDDITRP